MKLQMSGCCFCWTVKDPCTKQTFKQIVEIRDFEQMSNKKHLLLSIESWLVHDRILIMVLWNDPGITG